MKSTQRRARQSRRFRATAATAMPRPVDVARKLCPKARANYIEAFENGDELFAQHEITTPLRLAHFLAQVLHESGGLTIEWESGAYSAKRLLEIFGKGRHSAAIAPEEAQRLAHNGPAIFERVYGLGNPAKAKELGNTRPGDGYRFRGGGLMQTTGAENYKRMSEKTGVDYYNHPELIVSAKFALQPALLEWEEGHCNDWSDKDDVLAISRVINLGNAHSTKTPNGLAERRAWLAKIKRLIGVRVA